MQKWTNIKSGIFQLQCQTFPNKFIGQTGTNSCSRNIEHIRDAGKNKGNTAFSRRIITPDVTTVKWKPLCQYEKEQNGEYKNGLEN